jgi:quinolinate synthase
LNGTLPLGLENGIVMFAKSTIDDRVQALLAERNAELIAHYYQRAAVQDAASFVGDSLAMARHAQHSTADVLVIAGVRFMAETAALLNPDKVVLLPESDATCSLAENCRAEDFAACVAAHPDHVVVSYVNSSVEVKALSDVVCTSANAVDVINSIPADRSILFAPDKHLGAWLQRVTGRDMVLWDATCEVHDQFDRDAIERLRRENVDARVLVHPECSSAILELADVVGSTSRLLREVVDHPDRPYIVVTEEGILKSMRTAAPFTKIIPAPLRTPNACACGECPYMKLTTLESIVRCLETMTEAVTVGGELRERALQPVLRMMAL